MSLANHYYIYLQSNVQSRVVQLHYMLINKGFIIVLESEVLIRLRHSLVDTYYLRQRSKRLISGDVLH